MHLGIRTATHFMDNRFERRGGNSDFAMTICVSESATVGIFCYEFKYLLLTVQMRSFARRVCVCVCARARVCVCVRERETVTSQLSVQRVRNHLNRGLFANTFELHHCICHATLFLSRA